MHNTASREGASNHVYEGAALDPKVLRKRSFCRSPHTSTVHDDTTVFDASTLLANIGGDTELFHDLIHLFLARHPILVDDIARATSGGDSAALRSAAHTLKGTAANVCAGTVVALASELEGVGRRGSLGEAPGLLVQLQDAVQHLALRLSQEQ